MKVIVNGLHESGRIEEGGKGGDDNEDYSGHAVAQVGRYWFLTMVPEVRFIVGNRHWSHFFSKFLWSSSANCHSALAVYTSVTTH